MYLQLPSTAIVKDTYKFCFLLSVKVPAPAHRFLSCDWLILSIFLTHAGDVLKLASKMYPIKGETW